LSHAQLRKGVISAIGGSLGHALLLVENGQDWRRAHEYRVRVRCVGNSRCCLTCISCRSRWLAFHTGTASRLAVMYEDCGLPLSLSCLSPHCVYAYVLHVALCLELGPVRIDCPTCGCDCCVYVGSSSNVELMSSPTQGPAVVCSYGVIGSGFSSFWFAASLWWYLLNIVFTK
jgi:hypothetical protein